MLLGSNGERAVSDSFLGFQIHMLMRKQGEED
jgi:hypothetical protein